VVWQDAVEALGQAVAWLAAVVAPEVVVIGGGLAQSGALLLEPLRAELERRLGPGPAPMLATAAYGDLAGCVGAGLLARDLLVGHR
jgi:glucokinase